MARFGSLRFVSFGFAFLGLEWQSKMFLIFVFLRFSSVKLRSNWTCSTSSRLLHLGETKLWLKIISYTLFKTPKCNKHQNSGQTAIELFLNYFFLKRNIFNLYNSIENILFSYLHILTPISQNPDTVFTNSKYI